MKPSESILMSLGLPGNDISQIPAAKDKLIWSHSSYQVGPD